MTRKASKLNELRMPLRFAGLRALDLSRQHRTVDCAGLQLALTKLLSGRNVGIALYLLLVT